MAKPKKRSRRQQSKVDTKSERRTEGVTSEWLKVSQTYKPQVVTIS